MAAACTVSLDQPIHILTSLIVHLVLRKYSKVILTLDLKKLHQNGVLRTTMVRSSCGANTIEGGRSWNCEKLPPVWKRQITTPLSSHYWKKGNNVLSLQRVVITNPLQFCTNIWLFFSWNLTCKKLTCHHNYAILEKSWIFFMGTA